MKTYALVLAVIFQMAASPTMAADLRQFLKHCAYGTLIGASAGVVTLAFGDEPGKDLNNVARGASLGLYGGIAYGIYRMNTPQMYQQPSFGVMPLFDKGRMEGLRIETAVFKF